MLARFCAWYLRLIGPRVYTRILEITEPMQVYRNLPTVVLQEGDTLQLNDERDNRAGSPVEVTITSYDGRIMVLNLVVRVDKAIENEVYFNCYTCNTRVGVFGKSRLAECPICNTWHTKLDGEWISNR